MFWVLQNNIFNEEGWESLVSALDRLCIHYSIHRVVPFAGALEPDASPPPGPVLVMGSYTLARVAVERGWQPGAFINDNFDFEVQERRWVGHMFNSPSWVGAIKDVPEQRAPFFIRPTTDSKAFSGFVTDWPEFSVWRSRAMLTEEEMGSPSPIDNRLIHPDTRVLVGAKKPIAREYRTWIVDGGVVTASLYKQGAQKCVRADVDSRVTDFAAARAAEFQPARAFVLDVFEDWDGILLVGEVNCINSSGFYAADVQKLAAALEKMSLLSVDNK